MGLRDLGNGDGLVVEEGGDLEESGGCGGGEEELAVGADGDVFEGLGRSKLTHYCQGIGLPVWIGKGWEWQC